MSKQDALPTIRRLIETAKHNNATRLDKQTEEKINQNTKYQNLEQLSKKYGKQVTEAQKLESAIDNKMRKIRDKENNTKWKQQTTFNNKCEKLEIEVALNGLTDETRNKLQKLLTGE